MPPVTAVQGELWQVLIQGRIEEQRCENVLWFRAQHADSDTIAHLLQEVIECFVTSILPVLSTTYVFERVVGRQMYPTQGPDYQVTVAEGESPIGAASGDAEPSFVSALISLRTSRGGRSGRGRMYVAGVAEVMTTASHIKPDSPLYAGLVAFVACMLGKFLTRDVAVDGSWEWGVFSRKLGGSKQPFNNAGFAPMVAADVVTELATTRSRKLGRGR